MDGERGLCGSETLEISECFVVVHTFIGSISPLSVPIFVFDLVLVILIQFLRRSADFDVCVSQF